MNIAVIGKGRVASHLIVALRAAGHVVTECGGMVRLCPVPDDADVVLMAVKDDAIASVGREMIDSKALVLHTAGSVEVDALPCARRGVLYPMQTFSMGRDVDFSGVPLFIEANTEEDVELLRGLAMSISGKVTALDSSRRKILHLAAVLCCNFVNHLYDLTDVVLKQEDIPFDVMLPLIDETADKVHSMSPHQAQTGPAIRWDEGVIGRHIDLLKDERMKKIYRLLSESIHELKK